MAVNEERRKLDRGLCVLEDVVFYGRMLIEEFGCRNTGPASDDMQ